jgi:hypothetical protein
VADDTTRRLLKLFGVAVTEAEDALAALESSAGGDPGDRAGAALEAFDRAARELDARRAEVERLIETYQARARAALAAHLRARGGA